MEDVDEAFGWFVIRRAVGDLVDGRVNDFDSNRAFVPLDGLALPC